MYPMTDEGTTFYPPSQTNARGAPSVGRNIKLVEQQFVLCAERKVAALAAVQQAIRSGIMQEVADGPLLQIPFHFSNEAEMLVASTLEELLTACGFSPLHADGATGTGAITGLELASEFEYAEENMLFKLLAPFVAPGFLELKSDDTYGARHWRYNFNGTRCDQVDPRQVWPPYHPEDQPGGEALLVVPARYHRHFLECLWTHLHAVPTSANGADRQQGEQRIEEAFYLWRRGTPLAVIRQWFDAQYADWGGARALTSQGR
jgi:hypothetical protein